MGRQSEVHENEKHEPVITVFDWMVTYTGKKVFPLKLRPDDVDSRDIAHSLALQCRFAGHCSYHYSVGQHSLMVYSIIHHLSPNPSRILKMMALLHDASEAYLVDLPRPVKATLTEYKKYEQMIQSNIYRHYDVLPHQKEDALIKEADNIALTVEHFTLMPDGRPWTDDGIKPELVMNYARSMKPRGCLEIEEELFRRIFEESKKNE